ANGTTVHDQSIDFTWSATPGAVGYEVYIALNSGTPALLGTTDASETTLHHDVAAGSLEWYVRTLFNGCPELDSSHSSFVVVPPPPPCSTPDIPVLSAPSTASANVDFPVRWNQVANGSVYEIEEALSPAFTAANTLTVSGTEKIFKHDNAGTDPIYYYYRVR